MRRRPSLPAAVLVLVFLVALASVLFALPSPANAGTFWVSPDGSDTNPGSRAKPFRTLAGACRAVPPDAGHVIRLTEGTFAEADPCRVPARTSVLGAGVGKTVVRWSAVEDLNDRKRMSRPERFAVQVRATRDATFTGFTLDGRLPDGGRAHGGLLVDGAERVTVRDIHAVGFNYCGVFLANARQSSVRSCRFDDCGHPHKEGCSGALQVGGLDDCAIHDNVIRENRGAYGIKSGRPDWGDGSAPAAPGGDGRTPIHRVRFYNNDIRVRQQGGWGQGQPNMVLELWNCKITETEIYNNHFNECVSLVGETRAPKTVRIHHNRFVLEPGYSYAIEVSTHGVEIDHNYFANGYYPIASFGPGKDGVNIHHNVFDGIENIALLLFRQVTDFRFTDNTVIAKGDFPVLSLGAGVSDGVRITGNVFYKTGGPWRGEFVRLSAPRDKPDQTARLADGGLTVTGNAFLNWPTTGQNVVEGFAFQTGATDPERPWRKYAPAPGSPRVGAIGTDADPWNLGPRQ